MAVLVTAIHVLVAMKKNVDARNKSGHDEVRWYGAWKSAIRCQHIARLLAPAARRGTRQLRGKLRFDAAPIGELVEAGAFESGHGDGREERQALHHQHQRENVEFVDLLVV